MSAKNKQGDTSKGEEDEELLPDFRELFPDDETSPEGTDESLNELDAFIDEFEADMDTPNAATSDANSERQTANSDVGLDGEIYTNEPSLDEGDGMQDEKETSVVAAQDELALNVPAAEATASATPSKHTDTLAVSPDPSAVAPLSRKQLLGAAATLGVALLLSLSALWMGIGLGSRLDALNENVNALQRQIQAKSRHGSIAPAPQIDEQLSQFDKRINDLAVIVEGPLAHLRASNNQAMEIMNMRLDRLEKGQSTLSQATTGKQAAVAAQLLDSDRPQVSSAKATEPTAATKAETSKEAWVINLLSLTSAKAANAELERLRKLGIRADKQSISQEGKTWYRLRVTGFESYEGAKAYIDTVERQTGFDSAWVGKAE